MRGADQFKHPVVGTRESKVLKLPLWRLLAGWWRDIRRATLRPAKRLRLCESLPLGERRFVAVVEFEQSRFLIGGTQASLVLLAPLQRWAEPPSPGENSGQETMKPPLLSVMKGSKEPGARF